MQRSLDEVRQQGLDALRQRLGRADMIRFLQQFETDRVAGGDVLGRLKMPGN